MQRQRIPNPYAVIVAPLSMGKIKKGDVLVDNFDDRARTSRAPARRSSTTTYGERRQRSSHPCPQRLAACPGGVGLTTAMAALKSPGYVIVGSMPSTDEHVRNDRPGLPSRLRCQWQVPQNRRRPHRRPWKGTLRRSATPAALSSRGSARQDFPPQSGASSPPSCPFETRSPQGRPEITPRRR